ncbi:serrate RNA effector molecule homolog [Oppia nitens]|uniref:serrate RNA effector molecule homolog n=1 Tax=Oppia nitens TaxID=1686743 RepID=UPI0023DAC986|nr:serrate RNA effector molecule homolog [Oppia nitens]
MGDSDDDFPDRRGSGRDKFRRERSDYNDRNSSNNRTREDWTDRRESGGAGGGGSWGNQNRDRNNQRRDNYRDNYSLGQTVNQRRDRYSPADRSNDMSPPMKRMRSARDWEDRTPYPNYDMGAGYGGHHNSTNWSHTDNSGPNHQNQHREGDTGPTQPAMMTFKHFLGTQDDGIDDQIAVKKYNEYKLDFKKRQILEFFNAHKDEEWFRSKYHPEEFEKRKQEQSAALKKRLDVFLDLLANNWIDSVSIDVEKASQIIRLLDAAVIKLEDGTDFDLKSLDENFDEPKSSEPDLSLFAVEVEKPVKPVSDKSEKEAGEESDNDDVNNDNENATDNEPKEEKEVTEKDNDIDIKPEAGDSMASLEEGEASMDATSDVKTEEDVESKVKTEDEQEDLTPKANNNTNNNNNNKMDDSEKPRALHKTLSVFMRNLAPSILRQEIEELCGRYPGFLRLCIADPTSERRFFRRGWAAYDRSVNIREICWSLNSIKLRDTELNVIVNRDLNRRIRSVNGIASHKNVVRADIRHAAKIVLNLDKQKKLWEDETNDNKELTESKPMFGFTSKNPLLKNITDYLIEEASAEEEELLGTSEIGEVEDGEEGQNNGPALDRDENLIKVLDRLLLYLRIVHSVDYYNHSDYPNEDEMPNRIGIMHARGMSSTASRVTQQEINEYTKNFETKIQPYLLPPTVVTEEEAQKLGLKDTEVEAENFIKANIQEISKDKWLCPLSGKKFKGPDFVRKHILNKHNDNIEEAKQIAVYYNNYVFDPKRPQLPEHPSNRPQTNTNRGDGNSMGMGGAMSHGYMPHGPGPYPPLPYMAPGYGPRGPPMMGPMMGYGRGYPPMGGPMHDGYGRGLMGQPQQQKPRFTRKRINYRDLDAPNDDNTDFN